MHERPPLVTVAVPNYRHARYLKERLESIANQTFTDVEVLLLDDASPDESLKILTEFAAGRPRWSVHPNDQNSGSPFAQWNKAAALARGTYLWIAESDDVADPMLLEVLVRELESDPGLGIAYAQSMLIDEQGTALHTFDVHYRYVYGDEAQRWERGYRNNGEDEIRQYMLLHNVVPNASGALFRLATFREVGGADPTWKLNGDWMTYIKLLERSSIAFVPEVLNYFRIHPHTARQKANETGDVYRELLALVDYIAAHHHPERQRLRRAYRNVAAWWTHSLYRQDWRLGRRRANIRVNWALFRRFMALHPLVLLHIPYEGLVRLAVRSLELLGLKEPLRRTLHRAFPKHFMPRAT
ncbi:MAG: glycosyltransferase family 2 protein [Cryomorphaceae bacterium]|jgi:glycosyltransferase involved in cell wall biosynthesis|nr:glycosyltransferase family 2 protein [Cryomorphaceae bacterium]